GGAGGGMGGETGGGGGEQGAIACREGAAPGDERIEPCELSPRQRGGHVRQLGVRARRQRRALVVVAHLTHARGQRGGPEDCAALARRDHLRGAERADPERAAAARGPPPLD